MRNQLTVALLGCLGLMLFAGRSFFTHLAPWQTERFPLSAGPAAARGYPMEVEAGRFTTPDGRGFVVPTGFLQGSWGASSTSWVSGDGTSPAPDSLALRWFSYTEDKFYEGHWALPQRQLYDLLRQRLWVPSQRQYGRYHELTVCMLPTGVAVVWLTGPNQVLIGRYQAREIAFDFRRFNSAANRPLMIQQEQAKLPPAVQAQIASHTLSSQPWDDYLTTYPWKIELSQPLALYQASVAYFSAERDFYAPDPATAPQVPALLAAQPRRVPRYLSLKGTLPDGRRRQLRVQDFDEAQTLAAFRTLHAAHPDAPLTLRLETDADFTQGQLALQNAYQLLSLTCSKLEIYTPHAGE